MGKCWKGFNYHLKTTMGFNIAHQWVFSKSYAIMHGFLKWKYPINEICTTFPCEGFVGLNGKNWYISHINFHLWVLAKFPCYTNIRNH